MVDRKKKQVNPDEIVDGEVIGEFDGETVLNLPKVGDIDPMPAPSANVYDTSRRDFVLRMLVGGAAALAVGGSAALLVNKRQQDAQRTEVILPYGATTGPDQPANVAELIERIATLEHDLAAMTAARDQAVSDLNVSNTESAELRAQLDAALAQLEDAQGLNGLWQSLDDVNLDGVVAGALSIVGASLVLVLDLLASAQAGMVAAQTAVQKFLSLMPGPRAGIVWLAARVTSLSADLDWLSTQVQQAVQPAQPFATLIAEFVIWVLDRLPFGAGDRAKAGLEAMKSVVNSLPETITGIEDTVLDPLAAWFSEDKSGSLSAILIDPVQQKGLNPAKDLMTQVTRFKDAYNQNFAIPAQAALDQRAAIRSQIQAAQVRSNQES